MPLPMTIVSRTYCLVAAALLYPGIGYTQQVPPRLHPISLQTELGGLVSSSGQVPFWLQANQYGTVPRSATTARLGVSLRLDYRLDSLLPAPPRKVDWGGGLEVVGFGGATNQVILSEAFLKGRWGIFELFGGRRKQLVGLIESPLSSGSFIWSGNALPLPRLQIGIPTYTPLGFTKNWIALKGFFAHGWFGNGAYVQRSYLHQKAVYLRLGRDQSRVRLYAAFNHQAQWGGYAPFLERDPTSSFGGQIADSFEAYLNVVLPLKSDALKNLAKFTTYDQNRVGDHRGAAEAAVEIRLAKWSIFAYQQHFYDLGRKLYNLRNIEDGLYGIRLINLRPDAPLGELTLELFNSGGQGVIQFGRSLGGEAENYFLNGQYPDGWSYRGRTLGTPFLTQASEANPVLPRIPFSGYRADNRLIAGEYGINNNRVWALYAGAAGKLARRCGYAVKVSYSKNYGTFTAPFPARTRQLSASAGVDQRVGWLGGAVVLLSVGYDGGQLLQAPHQLGLYAGIRKAWIAHPSPRP